MKSKRSDFIWAVALALLMAGFFSGLASAQDSSQDQAAIEQVMMDSMPKESDLPKGILWEPPEVKVVTESQDSYVFVHGSWIGHKTKKCPQGSAPDSDDFSIQYGLSFNKRISDVPWSSPESYRSWKSPDGIRYPILPGGIIEENENHEGSYSTYKSNIDFWKSSSYQGYVLLRADLSDRCQPPFATREAEAKALIHSECERLAKLVYDRLPGGDVAQPLVQSAALPSASSSESLAPKQAAQDDYPDEDATDLELGKILQKKLASIDSDKDISKDALKEVKTRKAEVIAASTTASKRQPTKSQPERYDQAVLRGVWEGIKNGVVFISPWYVKYPLSWGPWLIEKLPKYLKKGDDESVKKTWIDKYGREKPEGTRPME